MSHERDQAKLQRHIREAEDRATAGGHELGPWQPASLSGLYPVEAVCLCCGEKVQAGYTTLYGAFDRVCPGVGVWGVKRTAVLRYLHPYSTTAMEGSDGHKQATSGRSD
jgi:hypothetical protein